jgi:protein associated with RNAse G/E
MPAEWVSSSHVTTVDLDLDVIRLRDGTVFLDDEDEFAEHQISLGYPKDVIEKALETSRWLMKAVAERREPFGDAGMRYLKMLA